MVFIPKSTTNPSKKPFLSRAEEAKVCTILFAAPLLLLPRLGQRKEGERCYFFVQTSKNLWKRPFGSFFSKNPPPLFYKRTTKHRSFITFLSPPSPHLPSKKKLFFIFSFCMTRDFCQNSFFLQMEKKEGEGNFLLKWGRGFFSSSGGQTRDLT